MLKKHKFNPFTGRMEMMDIHHSTSPVIKKDEDLRSRVKDSFYSVFKTIEPIEKIVYIEKKIDEVEIFNHLPDPRENINKLFIVKNKSGIIFINRKKSGVYISNGKKWKYLVEKIKVG